MNNKLPGIVSLSIFSAIVVIFWIFFGVYRAITAKSTPQVSAQIIEPITPSLDTNAIKNLGERVFIDQNQIPKIEEFPGNTFILFNDFNFSNKLLSIEEVNLFVGTDFLILIYRRGLDEKKLLANIVEIAEKNIEKTDIDMSKISLKSIKSILDNNENVASFIVIVITLLIIIIALWAYRCRNLPNLASRCPSRDTAPQASTPQGWRMRARGLP